MNEYPKQINIAFMKTNRWITGAGEEAILQIPPAILNAVFKITGKRFRFNPSQEPRPELGVMREEVLS